MNFYTYTDNMLYYKYRKTPLAGSGLPEFESFLAQG